MYFGFCFYLCLCFLKMETRRNMPQGRLMTVGVLSSEAPLRSEGAGIRGKPSKWAQKGRNKSWKRWPHLTESKEQSSHQPSATLLQFGPSLCNPSLTVYVGDVHSAFTFINWFDPHNPGEETRAGLCRLLLPKKKNRNSACKLEWASQDLTPTLLTPSISFHCCM